MGPSRFFGFGRLYPTAICPSGEFIYRAPRQGVVTLRRHCNSVPACMRRGSACYMPHVTNCTQSEIRHPRSRYTLQLNTIGGLECCPVSPRRNSSNLSKKIRHSVFYNSLECTKEITPTSSLAEIRIYKHTLATQTPHARLIDTTNITPDSHPKANQ
ncbi:hypothetical protein BDV93DRAFT_517728 [Ceratobasidium sp. AG-I]|nr:hypothetical protein BDV93DRAFT_517728 [Ceratobasidium sp. AG-I]